MRATGLNFFVYSILCIVFLQYSFVFSAWLPRLFIKTEEIKTTKEYALNPDAVIKIKNTHGSIIFKTSSEPKIIISTHMQGTPEEIKQITSNQQIKPTEAVITTEQKLSDSKARLDYEIIIPETVTLKLATTEMGDIQVSHFKGKINKIQIIDNGNITLSDIHSPVHALITNNGNIAVINPHDALHNIMVTRGNIDITDSVNSVIAKTNRGSITVKQKIFHEPFILFLETSRGNISVSVPQKLNAHVHMTTQKGAVSSTFPITLKPITMKINTESWSQLRRNIEGIIGNGGAPITLDVAKGNIVLDVY